MTNKDKLIQMINNLNESGIDLILKLFKDCDQIEMYNINTTPERIAELQQIEELKEEQRKEQFEEEQKRAYYERSRAEYNRTKEFRASLTGKEKRLIETLKNVDPGNYNMCTNEVILFADIYNNNLINGRTDLFNYGFLKGQRALLNKQKASKKQAKVG